MKEPVTLVIHNKMESTLCTIRDSARKISYLDWSTARARKSVRTRHKEMERSGTFVKYVHWIPSKEAIRTTFLKIKEEAFAICEDLKKKAENSVEVLSFSASGGWFSGFKNRYAFHSVKLSGQAVRWRCERPFSQC